MSESNRQKNNQDREADLARLRGLRPIDDDFMRCIFRDNIPLVQFVLRILTGKQDLIVDDLSTQKDMKRLVDARSIVLDVYASDSDSNKYDIEIQRAIHGADKHRARYHSSAMDIENLNAGQSFDELPETYTIFITESDIFGDGKPFHRIERMDLDTEGKPAFEDGEHILYVNGDYRGDSDIGKLMHDFRCWNPDEMNYSLMRDASRYFKTNPKGVEIMCQAFEDIRNEKAIRIALRMIDRGKLSLQEIAEYTELPLEKIQALAEKRTA